ncbi:MAG: hypothetical protein HYV63_31755 [Candidatus Schekmanbacteria bacterium]|nr:hypothetical protein [Candidatus Schekmanbacteria bacterium]
MSDLDASRAATCDAAEAIGRSDLGRLAPGAVTDVVLLRRDPMDDVVIAVAGVAAVVRDGRLGFET